MINSFSLKKPLFLLFCYFLLATSAVATDKVLVYAAASTSNAITEICKQFNQTTADIKVKVSFASSSTLAKQIDAGAPADIFISASPKWMDYLQKQQLIINDTRHQLLTNKIVLITPKGQQIAIAMTKKHDLAAKINGKLCLGDPDHVPVGIYAKQALITLGWWKNIKPQVVGTKDVRAALNLVERGECAAGIVYSTDAYSSAKVDQIGEFPEHSHSPIIYPVSKLKAAKKSADIFLKYLNSAAATTVFNKYGFSTK